MKKQAGIALYRFNGDVIEFLMILPTATHVFPKPLWMLPKGGIENGETKKEAALREFTEECLFNHNDSETEELIKHIKETMLYFSNITTKYNDIAIFYAEDNRDIKSSTNYKYASNFIEEEELEHLTENQDWKWFSENEINNYSEIHPPVKEFLKKLIIKLKH